MHQSLYSKYRPKSFSEVVGQEHITSTLEKQIKQGRIHHAYLFSGPRGTGKTTTARIIAKLLETYHEDIYEIDAASNRRIDDIRNIKEHITSLPLKSKYKIYIIDEAHMLTKEASNALLKTLEEPPHYAIFILATTEKHKILDTIKSRCQVFDFKQPSPKEIKSLISKICQKEGLQIDDNSLNLIARHAQGSFRDALSILEKIISHQNNKKITEELVLNIIGENERSTVFKIISYIAENKPQEALKAFENLIPKSPNFHNIADNLLSITRDILLLRHNPNHIEQINHIYNSEELDIIKKYSNKEYAKINANTLAILLSVHEKTATSPSPLYIEIALIKIIENA